MAAFYAVVLTTAAALLAFGPRIDRWLRNTPAPKETVQYGPLPKRHPTPAAAVPVLNPDRRWPPAPDLPLLPYHVAAQLHEEARAITRQAADTG